MNTRLEIKKGLIGGYTLGYDCPKCLSPLKSPLDEAGTSQSCPDCGQVFTVPGKAERERIRGDEAREAQIRRQEKDQTKQSKRAKQQELFEARRRVADENRIRRIAAESFERESAASSISDVTRCPFCSEEILSTAKKCKHCGEFLQPTGHSDFTAGCLGLLLGPVGLWYKGHWAAGFAWLAMIFIISIATGGFGLLLAPVFWIGMAIHAASVKPKRS